MKNTMTTHHMNIKNIVFCLAMLTAMFFSSVVANADTITVTNSYANIRSSPGASNKYLGQVKRGQTLELLDQGKAPNGKVWYKANYNGKNGWICSSFADINKSVTSPSVKTTQTRETITIIGEPTNIRSGAGYTYKVIGKAHKNNVLTKIGSAKDNKGNNWSKIEWNGTTGWVLSSLTKNGNVKVESKTTNGSHGKLIGTFTATGYCGVENGEENRYTKNGYCLIGKSRTQATTIAVDPSRIKLGTKVYIEFPAPYSHYNGYYVARDIGGAIKGNIIDLYIGWDNLSEMENFGRRSGVKIYYA